MTAATASTAATTATPSTPTAAARAVRLAGIAPATAVVQLVVAVVVASLAASRADDGALSALAMVVLAVGTAASSAVLAWPSGLYAGALELLDGGAEPDCEADCPSARDDDPFLAKTMRRRALVLAGGVTGWALASAGLLAAVLDNRPARVAVIIAGLVGIGASSTVVVDAAARHRGAHAAARLRVTPATPEPLRRRAWVGVAVPLALSQALVNAGVAWILFHDDVVHDPMAAHALTRASAFADVPVVVTILAVVFAFALAGAWGGVDARLGRVALDDPSVQAVRRTEPLGVQAIVYVALSGFFLANAISWFLPSSPSLAQVMVARGVFAGVLVALFAAVGYVRGALNGMAEA